MAARRRGESSRVRARGGSPVSSSPGRVLLASSLPSGRAVRGVGIDLCEVPRIARALARHGGRFTARIFREGEIRRPESSPAYPEHVAGLFAAKEAAMKALGTGMRGVAFLEIAITRQSGGPPRLALHGRAAARAAALGVGAAHVTITHTRELAAAVVLLLGD